MLLTAVLLGNLLGGTTCYFLGDKLLPFLRKLEKKFQIFSFLNKENEEKASKQLQDKGPWIIAFSRFLPGIRFFIAIIAGIIKLNPWKFYISFMIGVILWNSLLVFAGRVLVEDWALIKKILGQYTVVVLLFVTVIGLLSYRIKQKAR